MGDYDQLFKLVVQNCTAEQIKDLLRTATGNKNVKVSASSKEELVETNLRDALNSHSLDIEKVYDLLREGEENGPQHIYYLRCPSKELSQTLTLAHVTKSFTGTTTSKFPHLSVKQNGYIVADIRAWSSRKPLDWAVKIYGHEVREEATGEIIRVSDTRILKAFEQREYRHILMARWNAPDLLELRVPRDSSSLRIDHWRKILEEKLRTVVPFERFKPWSLKQVSKTLFDNQAKYKKTYRLGDAQLEDPNHNHVTFQSYVADSDLFATAATQSAAQGLLDNNATYKQQRVLWLEQNGQPFAGEISCLIGARLENEVVFFRHQNSRGIDYVTSQLRAFSKR